MLLCPPPQTPIINAPAAGTIVSLHLSTYTYFSDSLQSINNTLYCWDQLTMNKRTQNERNRISLQRKQRKFYLVHRNTSTFKRIVFLQDIGTEVLFIPFSGFYIHIYCFDFRVPPSLSLINLFTLRIEIDWEMYEFQKTKIFHPHTHTHKKWKWKWHIRMIWFLLPGTTL